MTRRVIEIQRLRERAGRYRRQRRWTAANAIEAQLRALVRAQIRAETKGNRHANANSN